VGVKFVSLFLCVDDILLAINDKVFLYEVKQFLSNSFDMKDMGDTYYVIDIKIQRDRVRRILSLSQEVIINKVLERFQMKECSPSVAPMLNGNGFRMGQCPKNDFEREQMLNIPYASVVWKPNVCLGCTQHDIAFVIVILSRFHNN
jgi:hypothetical protein